MLLILSMADVIVEAEALGDRVKTIRSKYYFTQEIYTLLWFHEKMLLVYCYCVNLILPWTY